MLKLGSFCNSQGEIRQNVSERVPQRPNGLTLLLVPPSQPDTGAAAILVDELHSCTLKCANDSCECRRVTRVAAGLNISHRVSVDLGGLGKVPHTPI
jgi:hypothetical protein